MQLSFMLSSASGGSCYQSLRKCCKLIQKAPELLFAALLQLPDCTLSTTSKMTSFSALVLCQNWCWNCYHLKLLDPQNLVCVIQPFPCYFQPSSMNHNLLRIAAPISNIYIMVIIKYYGWSCDFNTHSSLML